ncbi:adenylate/guanylate cyclase domain-containing protein [Aliiglaciecola lipolytica]|uniref:Guanylate cyclase domain-containing protein n=1 Tax=Aliiglaciecola lipolytica E3 TaxID=1127673 RepID=K6XSI8_9ALTE|nr:adenylate/guanylate cyclase domain-containing protein [Aliiglaciecola lipolytica]GAC14651.1 hypothetical protein GLIP_2023 [Aliiglaciecola lipolytica E3]
MLTSTFRRIALLGKNKKDLDNLSHIKLVNTIALMVLVFLVLQIPFILRFWHFSGFPALILCIVHIGLFYQVLRANYRHHFITARSLLMCGFVSYIGISSLIWSVNIQFHFLFIIGLFVSPFLYREWEKGQYVPNLIIYLVCFCGIEVFWQLPSRHLQAKSMEEFWLTMGTGFLLSIAAITSSLLIHENTRMSLERVCRDKARISHILQKTLPKPLIKNLLANFSNPTPSSTLKQHFCSVLFADIQGYTQHCSDTDSREVMHLLNDFYCEFDLLSRQNQLQKIKTNGDQYMAVCGIYEQQVNPAAQCCLAAISMLKSFNTISKKLQLQLKIRIGIASGPITAGCVGLDNMLFDVWGDAVNLASRLESHGTANKILVCQDTYLNCQKLIKFESGNKLNIKGLGTLTTYFVRDTV